MFEKNIRLPILSRGEQNTKFHWTTCPSTGAISRLSRKKKIKNGDACGLQKQKLWPAESSRFPMLIFVKFADMHSDGFNHARLFLVSTSALDLNTLITYLKQVDGREREMN